MAQTLAAQGFEGLFKKSGFPLFLAFLETAVDQAILKMPKDFEIKGFLEAHLTEVKSMLVAEYDEEMVREMFKNEGRAQGLAQGEANRVAKERTRMRQLMSQLAKETHREDLQPVGENDEYFGNLYKAYSIE